MFHKNLSTAASIQELMLKLFKLPSMHCLFIAEEMRSNISSTGLIGITEFPQNQTWACCDMGCSDIAVRIRLIDMNTYNSIIGFQEVLSKKHQ